MVGCRARLGFREARARAVVVVATLVVGLVTRTSCALAPDAPQNDVCVSEEENPGCNEHTTSQHHEHHEQQGEGQEGAGAGFDLGRLPLPTVNDSTLFVVDAARVLSDSGRAQLNLTLFEALTNKSKTLALLTFPAPLPANVLSVDRVASAAAKVWYPSPNSRGDKLVVALMVDGQGASEFGFYLGRKARKKVSNRSLHVACKNGVVAEKLKANEHEGAVLGFAQALHARLTHERSLLEALARAPLLVPAIVGVLFLLFKGKGLPMFRFFAKAGDASQPGLPRSVMRGRGNRMASRWSGDRAGGSSFLSPDTLQLRRKGE